MRKEHAFIAFFQRLFVSLLNGWYIVAPIFSPMEQIRSFTNHPMNLPKRLYLSFPDLIGIIPPMRYRLNHLIPYNICDLYPCIFNSFLALVGIKVIRNFCLKTIGQASNPRSYSVGASSNRLQQTIGNFFISLNNGKLYRSICLNHTHHRMPG